jgi:hypothetical protein
VLFAREKAAVGIARRYCTPLCRACATRDGGRIGSGRIGGTRRMLRPVTASGAQSVSAYPQSPVGRSRPRQLPRPGWSPGRSRLSPADTGVTGQPVAPARRITGEIWILRLPAWGVLARCACVRARDAAGSDCRLAIHHCLSVSISFVFLLRRYKKVL